MSQTCCFGPVFAYGPKVQRKKSRAAAGHLECFVLAQRTDFRIKSGKVHVSKKQFSLGAQAL